MDYVTWFVEGLKFTLDPTAGWGGSEGAAAFLSRLLFILSFWSGLVIAVIAFGEDLSDWVDDIASIVSPAVVGLFGLIGLGSMIWVTYAGLFLVETPFFTLIPFLAIAAVLIFMDGFALPLSLMLSNWVVRGVILGCFVAGLISGVFLKDQPILITKTLVSIAQGAAFLVFVIRVTEFEEFRGFWIAICIPAILVTFLDRDLFLTLDVAGETNPGLGSIPSLPRALGICLLFSYPAGLLTGVVSAPFIRMSGAEGVSVLKSAMSFAGTLIAIVVFVTVIRNDLDSIILYLNDLIDRTLQLSPLSR